MRLLNSETRKLAAFVGKGTPPYAILSHTWGAEEVSFQDINGPDPASKKGYTKIEKACNQAVRDGFEWVWVDTCCIDKTSSAELSEAINSMFRWYQEAAVCYVYLADVPSSGPNLRSLLYTSRWWTRGWTLQELLAPQQVEFYTSDWVEIGTKFSLGELIQERTGISMSILHREKPLHKCLIGERISWAAERETTREEDMAYSLLGILDVQMPLLYGEGARAFRRLQEYILQETEDCSLFLWNHAISGRNTPGQYAANGGLLENGVLAPSPSCFGHVAVCHEVKANHEVLLPKLTERPKGSKGHTAWEKINWSDLRRIPAIDELCHMQNRLVPHLTPPSITPRGLRIDLLAKPLKSGMWLVCTNYGYSGRYHVGMQVSGTQTGHFIRATRFDSSCLTYIRAEELNQFDVKEFYLVVESRQNPASLDEPFMLRINMAEDKSRKIHLKQDLGATRFLELAAAGSTWRVEDDGAGPPVETEESGAKEIKLEVSGESFFISLCVIFVVQHGMLRFYVTEPNRYGRPSTEVVDIDALKRFLKSQGTYSDRQLHMLPSQDGQESVYVLFRLKQSSNRNAQLDISTITENEARILLLF